MMDKEKLIIETPQKSKPVDYSSEIEKIRAFFGKLYVKGDEVNFNCKVPDVNLKEGVYYGTTKYTGNTNRVGTKEVAFFTADGATLVTLGKGHWKGYDNIVGEDGKYWIGYSDGISFHATVFKGKVKEAFIKYQLKLFGERIVDAKFYQLIAERVESLHLPTGEFLYNKAGNGEYDFYYCSKYPIAGVGHYVDAPFVSLGFARPEPENTFNNKAIAIYTDQESVKVGYVAEKDLSRFYAEFEGQGSIPLVMEAHLYNGRLYGYLYTFTPNVEENHYIRNQFSRLLKQYEEQNVHGSNEKQIEISVDIGIATSSCNRMERTKMSPEKKNSTSACLVGSVVLWAVFYMLYRILFC